MFKGFEHTVRCTKCKEVTVACGKDVHGYNKAEGMVKNKKSECCGAEYEYIGLQPVMSGILNVQIKKATVTKPAEQIAMVNNAAVAETPIIPQTKIENGKVEVVNEQPKLTVVKPEPVKAETATVNEDGIDIVDWIDSKKKMNNDYMMQLLRDAMEADESDKVDFLKANYPDVFQKSLRYIPAKLKRCFGL